MKRRLFFLGLALLAVRAEASRWVLANGDQLTGSLVSETSEAITIESPVLGRITVPRSALAAPVAAVPAKAKAAVAAAAPAPHWKKQLEFGYSQQSGVTEGQNLSVRLQLDDVTPPDTVRITAQVQEADSAGTRTSAERGADLRWRHELGPRYFSQTLTTWQSEPLRQLNQSVEQQVSAGVKLKADAVNTANLGLGGAYRYEDNDGAGSQQSILGTAFQDFTHVWSPNLKFSEESNVALASDRPYSPSSGVVGAPPVPADGGNYRVRFNALLQGKVTSQMTFNLRYDYDYDRSVPDPANRINQRVTTSLGYLW